MKILTFLICVMILTRCNCEAQEISVQIDPQEPVLGDTVNVYFHLFYAMAGCGQFNQTLTQTDEREFHGEALHCLGISPAFCETTDSFRIIASTVGSYKFRYTSYTSSSLWGGESCNNPNSPPFSKEDSVQFLIRSVGIEDVSSLKSGISIYPNPSNKEVTIELSGKIKKVGYLEIRNSLGQEVGVRWQTVATAGRTFFRIPVRNLPSGVYSVILRTVTQVFHESLIIKH